MIFKLTAFTYWRMQRGCGINSISWMSTALFPGVLRCRVSQLEDDFAFSFYVEWRVLADTTRPRPRVESCFWCSDTVHVILLSRLLACFRNEGLQTHRSHCRNRNGAEEACCVLCMLLYRVVHRIAVEDMPCIDDNEGILSRSFWGIIFTGVPWTFFGDLSCTHYIKILLILAVARIVEVPVNTTCVGWFEMYEILLKSRYNYATGITELY